MCGIAGILASKLSRENKNNSLKKMLLAINHRGPDDTGIWQDENYNVALGHVRLSILDLTTNGHQPMISHSNRYVLTYNGEIYNFRKIKQELDKSGKGFAWKSESDTEVILAAIEAWGLDQALAVVPLGAFLSGGIDSSTVVALMQQLGTSPVKTFSIGFQEEGYNEAEYAREVANHLATDHTELYVSSKQAMEVIPSISQMYSEPFADSSQIPTFFVSKLAREHVTVSLSGDGGDELFGGYNRYFWGGSVHRKIGKMPFFMRKLLANMITILGPGSWNVIMRMLYKVMSSRLRVSAPGDKMHKLAGLLATKNMQQIYYFFTSQWFKPQQFVIGLEFAPDNLARYKIEQNLEFVEEMMYLDLMTYLPDDILAKVDRAAMAVSLETRVPFLDHRIVGHAWKIPMRLKIKDGVGKWILRQILYKYVPKKMIDRPKMGFGMPVDSWLRGPLKEWASDFLSPQRLQRDGYFYAQSIQQKWQEHISGKTNWPYHLWSVLMFSAWLDHNKI